MDEDYWQDSNCHFEEIKAILRVTRNEVTNELVKMNSRLFVSMGMLGAIFGSLITIAVLLR